jgi:hypothetical protein
MRSSGRSTGEEREIRAVLRPDQKPRFEKHLQLAKEMKGSSRDAKDF